MFTKNYKIFNFEIENPPSLEILDRMIRAYYPWPNAWTRWEGKIVKFLPSSHPRPDRGSSVLDSRLPIGRHGFRGNDSGVLVQMEGKKPVKFEDFLRGYPKFPLASNLSLKEFA